MYECVLAENNRFRMFALQCTMKYGRVVWHSVLWLQNSYGAEISSLGQGFIQVARCAKRCGVRATIMQFVLIFGPSAVGKMTVGAALARLTGFKLFHNHLTIDLVLNVFPHGHPRFGPLVNEFRRRIFEEVASSDVAGLIFTYVWALDHPGDKAEIDDYCAIFRRAGGTVYFVELAADQATRLERNRSEFRLAHKPTKRNVAQSDQFLLADDARFKLNSNADFFYQENYLKINNTALSASETAQQIVAAFFRTDESV